MARPSKIHAQHTRSRPGLRIYTLSHLEFFISRKRKKENTRTLYGFSFGHSQSLYTAVIFFSPFDVCTYGRCYICLGENAARSLSASQDFPGFS
jgi:hypothetical protein